MLCIILEIGKRNTIYIQILSYDLMSLARMAQMLDFDRPICYHVEIGVVGCLDNKALNRSDTFLCGQIVPRMVASPFYHPLHSQIHTLIVARLTRALS